MSTHDENAGARNASLYQAATQSWVHAEQIRWTLLYNYLMTNSILLLAWAAVFTSTNWERKRVLVLLAIVGSALSLIWTLLEVRANKFAFEFHQVMLRWEEEVQGLPEADEKPKLGVMIGPARATESLRERLGKERVLAPMTSSRILPLIPAVFAVVYITLIVLSLRI